MTGNPEEAKPNWPDVVVAGCYLTGVVLMRQLFRRGVRVSAIDWFPGQPGFHTVYGKVRLCPNPDDQPTQWVDFMCDLAGRFPSKPVLIPSADQFVSAVANHAAVLRKHYLFSETMGVQALLATKQRQYEFAGSHGLPVPRTAFVQSGEELLDFAHSARFPCLLKPTHCREWERFPQGHRLYCRKLVVSPDIRQLEADYRAASAVSSKMVVQEIIEGPDTAKLVYLSCYSSRGERIGHLIVRQVRTDPIYFGSASVSEPVPDLEADRVCDQFLRAIGYCGICEIELKRDTRDGRLKMIEVNPRYSVTADAAPYAGVDIGWLHYLDLIGQKVAPALPSSKNFRHIVLLRDLACFRDYFRDGLLTWRSFLGSYRPPVHFFDLDWRDWKLALATLNTGFRLIAGPPLRRLFPKRSA
jgi:predicted ATP-grasp superfamily ATP-dependent carboligase